MGVVTGYKTAQSSAHRWNVVGQRGGLGLNCSSVWWDALLASGTCFTFTLALEPSLLSTLEQQGGHWNSTEHRKDPGSARV